MVNWFRGKSNWNYQKGKLKEKFAVLTEEDLLYEQWQKDKMLGKLQVKLNKSKEELDKIIEGL